MNISGNTVLITGGGSGIGLALAAAFCAHQNTVIIVGRDQAKLDAAKRLHPSLHIIQADISSEEDRQHLANIVQERFPQLNILINNAGTAFFAELHTDPGSFDKARQEIEINYLAPVRLVQLFLSLLQRQPTAAVINITTIGVYLPLAVMPGYSASKAALHSFTQSLRLQLEGAPVKVFEILPPPVDTELVSGFHMRKMNPARLAQKILHGLRSDRYEMTIGVARVLYWMTRLAPRYLLRLSHKQSLKATRPS